MYEQLYTQDLSVSANRLFGPPPQNATYLCIWEIRLGQVFGSASTTLIQGLSDSASSFSIGFKDTLDSIAEEYTPTFEPDVTFVSLVLQSADFTWKLSHTAIQVALPDGFRFDSNDFPGKNHKNTKGIAMPSIKIRCLLAESNSHPRRADEWFEVACASFDFHADLYNSPINWRKDALQQKLFVQSQDSLTGRATWVYDPGAIQSAGNSILRLIFPKSSPSYSRLSKGPLSLASCRSCPEIG